MKQLFLSTWYLVGTSSRPRILRGCYSRRVSAVVREFAGSPSFRGVHMDTTALQIFAAVALVACFGALFYVSLYIGAVDAPAKLTRKEHAIVET